MGTGCRAHVVVRPTRYANVREKNNNTRIIDLRRQIFTTINGRRRRFITSTRSAVDRGERWKV
jgi:hypothetical protein